MRILLVLLIFMTTQPSWALVKYTCRGIHGNTHYAIHRLEHGDFRVMDTSGKKLLRVLGLSARRMILQSTPQMVELDLVPEEGDIVATFLEGEKGITLIWNKLEFSCLKRRYK